MDTSGYTNLSLSFINFTSYNIRYPKQSQGDTFNELAAQLSNPVVISNIENILGWVRHIVQYNGEDYITAKEFLISYMIHHNSDAIFTKISEMERELLNLSNSMLSLFEQIISVMATPEFNIYNHPNIPAMLYELIRRMITFRNNFQAFKSKDKEDLLVVLLQSYFELNETFKLLNTKVENNTASEQEIAWHTVIPHQMGKVMEKILKLEPTNGMERIQNYVPPLADIESAQGVMRIAQKAYMDVLIEQLSTEPRNYTMFYKCVDEIRERLKQLTPSRQDIQTELNDCVDTSFIKQMIDNNAYTLEEFHKLVFYIIYRIEIIQAPSEDEDTNQWKDMISQTITTPYEFPQFSANFLLKCFEKIENIENAIITIATQSKNE